MLYSKQSGLHLQVNTFWVGEHGYRPVDCTFNSPNPVPADIQITIRFFAGVREDQDPVIVVEKDFELAAGTKTARFTMPVPEYVDWRSAGFETWIDGVKDTDLSLDNVLLSNYSDSGGGLSFSALVLGSEQSMPMSHLLQGISGSLANVLYLNANTRQYPDKWIDYSSLDVVIAGFFELQDIQEGQPRRFEELLRWIRSGGNLWIMETGESYQLVPEVESAIGIPADHSTTKITPELLLERDWRFPRIDKPGTDAIEKLSQLQVSVPPSSGNSSKDDNASSHRDSRHWFASRLYGMGTITVFTGPLIDLEDINETSSAIKQSLLADRLSWVGRHGNDPDDGNENFNDWLIPDVGTAPVTAFQVLLTLFVLGIGPVNYYLLKQREQLPYLLLTVPAASLATVFLLLLYSFVSDGFGAIVRARSFTLLDQRSGTAACWARLSYFAGLSPANGLEVPTDTLVYPILPSSRTGNYRLIRSYARQRRELHWNDSQQLVEGWLASRTPTQYLTISSRRSQRHIEFQALESGLQATNHLGVDVLALVVVDAGGKFYLIEDLPTNELLILSPSTQVQAMMLLRKLFSDNAPEFPAGTMESISASDAILHLPLSQNLMEIQMAAISSAVSHGWSPRTFVAVTNRGMDLSLGLEDISESASFHVIRGNW